MLKRLRPCIIGVLLLEIVLAASASAQILNSERIEQTFGSYGIDVLYSDEALRLSSLYSEHADQRIMRTFAIVAYPEIVDEPFATEHREILQGGSIGTTFTAAGWEVVKINLLFSEFRRGADLAGLMGGEAAGWFATHAYRLDIVRPGERYSYATIIEVHHPDYMNVEQLQAIYSQVLPQDDANNYAVRELAFRGFEKLGELELSLSE